MRIAVVDCAIETPAYECFNQMVDYLELPLSYHIPSQQGMLSLTRSFPECFIVLGSYSNLSDKLDWHRPLQEYLLKSLKSGTPVLGLCFGHQLMADGLGAKIGSAEKDFHGIREVSILKSAWSLEKGQTLELIASHGQSVLELPEEMVHLGSSSSCFYDMITHQKLPFLGVQAHPEASLGFVEQNLHSRDIFPPDEQWERALSDGLKLIEGFIEKAQRAE